MRADVEAALRGARRVAPLAWSGDPLVLTFTRVPFCDAAAMYPAARRLDGRTLEIGGADFEEALPRLPRLPRPGGTPTSSGRGARRRVKPLRPAPLVV